MAIDHSQPPSSKSPLLVHEFILTYVLLITALIIPTHRRLVSAIFLPLLWTSYYHLVQTTSQSPPAAFVIGAFVVFHAYYSFDLLVFRDPRTEFRRTDSYVIVTNNKSNGFATGPESPESQKEEGEPYPLGSLTQRIIWAFDLVCNMRGIGWNWAIRPIPPISAEEATSLRVFLHRRVVRLFLIWAWLDATMFWVHYLDAAYFLPEGNAYSSPDVLREPVYADLFSSSSKPQEYPPPRGFPTMPSSGVQRMVYQLFLHSIRTILQGALIYTSMNGVYTEFALAFAAIGGLVGLGKPGGWRRRWLDWRSWPDMFGGWREGDWGHGLIGWWGKAWHGLFKHVFTSPSRYIKYTFNIPSSSPIAIALNLYTPFIMSAALHFTGSYTKSSDGWGGARFFLVQPFGIIIEQGFLYLYRKVMPSPREKERDVRSATRKFLERWVPYVWALGWCILTSKPFFEDLRHGGVWAMQPVPISVWKGLWGVKEGWWPWVKETDMGWRNWWEWDSSMGGWGIRL